MNTPKSIDEQLGIQTELSDFLRSANNLEKMVESIRETDFRSNEGRALLLQFKHPILSHFARIQRDFAPTLTTEAQGNSSQEQIVRFFLADMLNVAKLVNDYYLKIAEGHHVLNKAGDCGRLYAYLSHCVHKQALVLAAFNQANYSHNKKFDQRRLSG